MTKLLDQLTLGVSTKHNLNLLAWNKRILVWTTPLTSTITLQFSQTPLLNQEKESFEHIDNIIIFFWTSLNSLLINQIQKQRNPTYTASNSSVFCVTYLPSFPKPRKSNQIVNQSKTHLSKHELARNQISNLSNLTKVQDMRVMTEQFNN